MVREKEPTKCHYYPICAKVWVSVNRKAVIKIFCNNIVGQ